MLAGLSRVLARGLFKEDQSVSRVLHGGSRETPAPGLPPVAGGTFSLPEGLRLGALPSAALSCVLKQQACPGSSPHCPSRSSTAQPLTSNSPRRKGDGPLPQVGQDPLNHLPLPASGHLLHRRKSRLGEAVRVADITHQ